MKVVCYERVCYKRGLFRVVCYEQVSFERKPLSTTFTKELSMGTVHCNNEGILL